MNKARNGDKVKVRYIGKSKDGELFGSTMGCPPLELKIGRGELPAGFEAGIVGMEPGETKRLTVAPEDGFGARIEELVVSADPAEVPNRITPKVGKQLLVQDGAGRIVTISRPDEATVILDANHPLAGKTLLFQVQLVEIL